MDLYEVFWCVSAKMKEIMKRCIRDLHGEDRASIREWYEQITAAIPCVEVEHSTYALLCVACPDRVFRVLAVEPAHIDEYFDKDGADIILDAPYLQEIPISKLLGMEVPLDNLIEAGYETYAEAFLRALMPGVDHRSYWTLRCVEGCTDGELDVCIKNALNYID